MRTVYVFPDFTSSGLWEQECGGHVISLDVSDVKEYISEVCIVALKYWHFVWELTYDYNEGKTGMSREYYQEWYKDGQKIVDTMNSSRENTEYGWAEDGRVIDFILDADKPEDVKYK